MIRDVLLENMSLWGCMWQSTSFALIGLIGSFLLRRGPARASQVLLLAMIAAVIVPAMGGLVKHLELGLFAAEPIRIEVAGRVCPDRVRNVCSRAAPCRYGGRRSHATWRAGFGRGWLSTF
jgi:hypothetical protein